MLWGFLLAVGFIAVLPDQAFAWGPGMHMVTAHHILDNPHLLSEALALLLQRHKDAFLYGCLSADIFIGKGSRAKRIHSHNWDTGKALLHNSGAPRLKAYAMGYMAHLAADVVAHNYYVPNVLHRVKLRGKATHVYVEMQADRVLEWDSLEAKQLFRMPLKDADFCLLDALNQSRLPFLVKKRIYHGSLYLSGRRVNNSLRFIDQRIPMGVERERVFSMQQLSLGLILDVLRNPTDSVVFSYDPIGSEHLNMVRRSRRRRNPLWRVAGGGDPFPVPIELLRLQEPVAESA